MHPVVIAGNFEEYELKLASFTGAERKNPMLPPPHCRGPVFLRVIVPNTSKIPPSHHGASVPLCAL